MIECIFTLDYEIYGNGEGSLESLVYEPAEKLRALFEKFSLPIVIFVEAAELEVIEERGFDPAIGLIKTQLRDLHDRGHELGLHLHPQWYNAYRSNDQWELDYGEYNLCRLSPERIEEIRTRSVSYLRSTLNLPEFSPLSFRAGNWLLQPTQTVSKSLAAHGIKVDSSVFKGGCQSQLGLDYRGSCKNGYYWKFSEDANVSDPQGILLEIPTFSRMAPIWKVFSAKRIALQQRGQAVGRQGPGRLARLKDFLRLTYPIKFDYCRLAKKDMIMILRRELRRDMKDPATTKPIVAIGHTKDLLDLEPIEFLLSYLGDNDVPVSTMRSFYNRILK